MDGKFPTASVETNSLIEKGLIHSSNATKDRSNGCHGPEANE